jgi:hypothetical protein
MELSPCWEANGHSVPVEISKILWNSKVCYSAQKSLPSGLYPELDESIPTSYLYKIHTPIYIFVFRFGFSTEINLLSDACYMPCPSDPPWPDHSNYIWRGVQAILITYIIFLKTYRNISTTAKDHSGFFLVTTPCSLVSGFEHFGQPNVEPVSRQPRLSDFTMYHGMAFPSSSFQTVVPGDKRKSNMVSSLTCLSLTRLLTVVIIDLITRCV